jgi:hypothetical protein
MTNAFKRKNSSVGCRRMKVANVTCQLQGLADMAKLETKLILYVVPNIISLQEREVVKVYEGCGS